ncbi:hypothetical protein MUN82_01945 [Hymenobacter aerilatus]|uniref:Uncharacterized protein n=1 Tax=Hymenobacter aerilatus TaxID=2932251 RepID=A0A8T9SYR3_9BACT|nr:hypothetical protein [Hymenobacter aerilatus]UOR05873.1 hypothetical protein MUN82_01945 [Hymenobacter aerilatus]
MNLYYSFYSNIISVPVVPAKTYLIDIGEQNGSFKTNLAGWNNVDAYFTSVSLVDSNNNSSSIVFNLIRGNSKGVNTSGFNGAAGGFPQSAWIDTMYTETDSADFTLTGLDSSRKYDLEFYGARGGVTDIRRTQIIINGVTKIYQNTTSDGKGSTTGATFTDIVPTNNTIAFNLNKNTGSFGYLGILKITEK